MYHRQITKMLTTENYNVWHILFLFTFFDDLVHGQITQGPTDMVVRVGNDVTLTCRVDDNNNILLEWRELISNTSGTRIFHNQYLNKTSDPSKYVIRNQYDLQIKGVTLSDGGLYRCIDDRSGDEEEAKIIVFKLISIGTLELVENRPGNMTFGTTFSTVINLPKPIVTVTVNGSTLSGEQTDFRTEPTTNQQSLYSLSGHVPHTANFGDVIEVTIENNSETKYEFSNQVTLDKKNINYGARNLVTSIDQSIIYKVGDEISCSAEGIPPPEFTWTPLTLSISSKTGNVLQITEEMMASDKENGTLQTWTVTASNLYNAVSVNITFTVDGGKNTALLATVVVLAVLLITCLILLAILFVKYKKLVTKSRDHGEYITTCETVPPTQGAYENAEVVHQVPQTAGGTYEEMHMNNSRPVGEDPYTNLHE